MYCNDLASTVNEIMAFISSLLSFFFPSYVLSVFQFSFFSSFFFPFKFLNHFYQNFVLAVMFSPQFTGFPCSFDTEFRWYDMLQSVESFSAESG